MTGIGIIDFVLAVVLGSAVVITTGMLCVLIIRIYEYLKDDEDDN